MRVELLTGLLHHRRAIVLGALATVTTAAWGYLLLGGGIETEMMDMGGGQMMAKRVLALNVIASSVASGIGNQESRHQPLWHLQ